MRDRTEHARAGLNGNSVGLVSFGATATNVEQD
jgi:hypothetical protein